VTAFGATRFGVTVHRLQKLAGLSVAVAAERLGVSRSTVKRWRRQMAHANPRAATLASS